MVSNLCIITFCSLPGMGEKFFFLMPTKHLAANEFLKKSIYWKRTQEKKICFKALFVPCQRMHEFKDAKAPTKASGGKVCYFNYKQTLLPGNATNQHSPRLSPCKLLSLSYDWQPGRFSILIRWILSKSVVTLTIHQARN